MRRHNDEALSELRARFDVLTPRGRAILVQVVEGRLNKQIAGETGITETTVKVHRSNLMRKLKDASHVRLEWHKSCFVKYALAWAFPPLGAA